MGERERNEENMKTESGVNKISGERERDGISGKNMSAREMG
jgi:hypothetical protein